MGIKSKNIIYQIVSFVRMGDEYTIKMNKLKLSAASLVTFPSRKINRGVFNSQNMPGKTAFLSDNDFRRVICQEWSQFNRLQLIAVIFHSFKSSFSLKPACHFCENDMMNGLRRRTEFAILICLEYAKSTRDRLLDEFSLIIVIVETLCGFYPRPINQT